VVAFEVINPKLAPPPAQAVTVPGWSKTATVGHWAFRPAPAQKIRMAVRMGLDLFITSIPKISIKETVQDSYEKHILYLHKFTFSESFKT
jgi:hypothetical protein